MSLSDGEKRANVIHQAILKQLAEWQQLWFLPGHKPESGRNHHTLVYSVLSFDCWSCHRLKHQLKETDVRNTLGFSHSWELFISGVDMSISLGKFFYESQVQRDRLVQQQISKEFLCVNTHEQQGGRNTGER